ncbi:MutS like ABC ATpase involved in DNA repair [Cryptosporidium ryanae]|uniref:MutS like ABC ATpase involved in DNA repair n=1 Tax=Cryptosporidium ryanae TaxID=515981 RepID=UPI00351A9A12|nr:MutS like ABC ATpase involved in DNA repair [Cryptosporidium ryanae]
MTEYAEFNFKIRIFCSIVAKIGMAGPIIGISFFDSNNGLFTVAEIEDNEQLSELESLLVRNKPTNIVYSVCKDKLGLKRLIDILEKGGSWILEELEYPKLSAIEDFGDLISPLLCKQYENYSKELESDLIKLSLYNSINHFQLVQSRENNSQCEIRFLVSNGFMRMDSACIHSLKIFPQKGESNRSPTNLLGLLNKTRTKIGARRLEMWLRRPLINDKQIKMRQDAVEFFYNNDLLRQKIYGTYLRKVCDLDQISVKFRTFTSYINSANQASKEAGGNKSEPKCGLEDMVKLYDSIHQSNSIFSDIKDTLEECERSKKDVGCVNSVYELILIPLESTLSKFGDYVKLVEKTIDLDEAENGNYLIIPQFTPELERLYEKKEEISAKIESHRKELDSYLCNKKGYNEGYREAVKVIRGEGMDKSLCFRVSRKDIDCFQDKKIYKQVRINKNDYLFRTREIQELSDKEDRILKDYNYEQHQVLVKAVSVASTYWSLVSKLSYILGSIDVLLSFALTSICAPIPFVRPVVYKDECTLEKEYCIENNTKDLVFDCSCRFYCKQLRHPLIEAQGVISANTQFVANDVDLHRHGNLLSIITGPNMGGKSTYIRQIAICCLLSQIGCFVPAQEARVPIMDQLMCRIGASDSQLLGISTFFAEMIEASAILRCATKNTLVVVDELGRGTSTYDGFGLAWSIASFLVNVKKCYTLFATHFHELSSLALNTRNVTNLRVTATTSSKRNLIEETSGAGGADSGASFPPSKGILRFYYKVEKGFADKSLGVDVAELTGLPVETIKRSREKAEDLSQIEQIYVDPHCLQNKKKNQLIEISSNIKSSLSNILNAIDTCSDPEEFKNKSSDSVGKLSDIFKFAILTN